MKKILSRIAVTALLALIVITNAAAMGMTENETSAAEDERPLYIHTDDLGNEHELPMPLDRISPSGNLAQMMLYALAPEKMVGLARPLSQNAMEFMLPEIRELPSFGNFFAAKGDFNREAIIMADPDVIFDAGEIKPNMKEDFRELEKQTGIPVIYIEEYLENTGDAIRKLGRLTGLEEKAEKLAEYAERTIDTAIEKRAQIKEPVTAYYSSSPDGLNGFPKGSFHGEIVDFMGLENVIPATFSEGGNQISIEQMMVWNPDIMLIQNRDAYKEITTDEKWAGLDAVKNGKVYLIPILPYPFLSNPPALNRLIGIWWLGNIAYPELWSDTDLEKEMKEFYSLFYHYELTDEEIDMILTK